MPSDVNHLGQPIGISIPEWTGPQQHLTQPWKVDIVASYRSTQTTTPQNSMQPTAKTSISELVVLEKSGFSARAGFPAESSAEFPITLVVSTVRCNTI
jgi:hypothetical protein